MRKIGRNKELLWSIPLDHEILREGTFFIGGGGTGLRRGGSLVNFLQIGEAQTCFIRNGGGVTVFLGKEKIYPCRLVDSCLLTNTRSV